jgi:hypothetical protein
MAKHTIYIDTTTGDPVAGATDGSVTSLPPFVQGDTLSLRIYLLVREGGRLSDLTQIPVSGLTLQVALGTRVGSTTTYYTQQFTWTASTDLAQPYFEADLPMNTEAIDTLLGASSTANAWFEVKVIEDAVPRTVLQKEVSVKAAVIKDGGVVVPAGLTPLSAEYANAAFLTREFEGSFIIRNAVTGAGVMIYVDEDGTFQADNIA